MDKEPHLTNSHIPKLAEDADGAKSAGSAVSFAANTHAKADLTIDQHRYSAKLVEDIAKVQAIPGLFEKEVSGMIQMPCI